MAIEKDVNLSDYKATLTTDSDITTTFTEYFRYFNVAGTDLATFMTNCEAASNRTIDQAHTNAALVAKNVRVFSIETQAEANGAGGGTGLVTIIWKTGTQPSIDTMNWWWELEGSVIQEDRALDYAGKMIRVKYFPDGMTDAEWALYENQKRFFRGELAKGYKVWIKADGRIRVSASKYNDINATAWNYKYAGFVNDTVTRSGVVVCEAGKWMCQGFRIVSPNMGNVTTIATQLIMNHEGFDPFIAFKDMRDGGVVPGQIYDNIPATAITAWPTLREPAAKPYGWVRPQMVRGKMDFNTTPLFIDIGKLV